MSSKTSSKNTDSKVDESNKITIEALKKLKNSTLFNLSLGSKELFHSNFLGWLAENYSLEVGSIFSKFINENKLTQKIFAWQEGYGSFSYSKKEISRVAIYIENQEEHHRKKSFKKEYIELLQVHEIKYEEKYLFEIFE